MLYRAIATLRPTSQSESNKIKFEPDFTNATRTVSTEGGILPNVLRGRIFVESALRQPQR